MIEAQPLFRQQLVRAQVHRVAATAGESMLTGAEQCRQQVYQLAFARQRFHQVEDTAGVESVDRLQACLQVEIRGQFRSPVAEPLQCRAHLFDLRQRILLIGARIDSQRLVQHQHRFAGGFHARLRVNGSGSMRNRRHGLAAALQGRSHD
jgi:hypothetical protein